MKLSKNFDSKEFECRCCGVCNVSDVLIKYLERIRSKVAKPVKISSGCRCVSYNKKKRGVKNSDHITTTERECKAADIVVKGLDVKDMDEIIRECDEGDLRYTGKTTYGNANHISVLKKVK